MKSFRKSAMLTVSIALAAASFALAAPSLDITKGPVTPVPSWTGPPMDPDALAGQWFLDLRTGNEEPRTHEFYDNAEDAGGGFASSAAIMGIPMNIVTGSLGGIVAFDIEATITNDTPSVSSALWRPGSNSHGEQLVADEEYKGTLYDTKLTVEFAVERDSFRSWVLSALPSIDPDGPYMLDTPKIYAEDPDELAWYCWSPDAPNPDEYRPTGDFLVPTYDFGDIEPGKSVSRMLHFTLDGAGLLPNDPGYEVLWSGQDIFLNRTTSLKISNWIDLLAIDDGTPYPSIAGQVGGAALLSSDVSVFHNVPEPSTLLLLALSLGLLVAARRRN